MLFVGTTYLGFVVDRSRRAFIITDAHSIFFKRMTDRYKIEIIILVEMLNIVGERERPNLGFVRDVRAA